MIINTEYIEKNKKKRKTQNNKHITRTQENMSKIQNAY